MASIITTIIIVLLAGALGYCVHYIPGVKQDNPVEEKCEKIIKDKTGVDIDLTPQSPEEKKE
jgi:hypothetical protein